MVGDASDPSSLAPFKGQSWKQASQRMLRLLCSDGDEDGKQGRWQKPLHLEEGSVHAASEAGSVGVFLPLTKAAEGRSELGFCT